MATSRPIVFPYGIVCGRPSPVATVGIFINGRWRVVELYVDTGAFYTLLHVQFATDFGLDFKRGRKVLAQVGDGGLIPVHLHKLMMQIGDTQFVTEVGFSEKLGVSFNLLGRLGVFEHFKICFHEKRKVVSFEVVD
ncbi:MAG: aspartyl protease family protein [Verrucomicrobia bacterium]|nr:aspartyl protease family protein [Verrucomicrobiota bacterium]